MPLSPPPGGTFHPSVCSKYYSSFKLQFPRQLFLVDFFFLNSSYQEIIFPYIFFPHYFIFTFQAPCNLPPHRYLWVLPPLHTCELIHFHSLLPGAFPGGSDGEEIYLQCGRPRFDPWVTKIPWRREWHPTPVFLPGKSPGWGSLAGYSLWGLKGSDTLTSLSVFSLAHSQCSINALNNQYLCM